MSKSRDKSPNAETKCRVAGGDDFIRKLWDIHLKVKDEEYVQVCYNNSAPELSCDAHQA